jgi:hypothetical protein
MIPNQMEWHDLARLEAQELKGKVFSLLQEASSEVQTRDPDDPDLLSVVPRLSALIQARPELESFKGVLNSFARSVGLWNYIDKNTAETQDRLLAEAVTVDELDGITLHREQILALNALLSGRNLILSAPTSFGKSILIDALMASGKFKRIAIVLPTIALLDEFRRRLTRRFREKFQVVMYHSQIPTNEGVVFLGTQERLIHREDLGALDLLVVDEFYKLDPTRQDDRSLTLNAAVYQLLRKAKQFLFLGPNIHSVRFAQGNRWRFEFLRTRFSTVAVDTYDLRAVENKADRVQTEAFTSSNWPALIFVSSPDRANQLASELIAEQPAVGNGAALADWIDQNFGQGWGLSRVVRSGVALHHGRIPRALASHFVRLFNSGDLPILLCTSTLIEGVNTAAKSVLIYDKTIQREDFDFFTFSNIRGRAGRLGEHHVGSVFLFHAPPAEEEMIVSAPLFGDLDDAPNELVVHISDEGLSPTITARVEELKLSLGLNDEELQLASLIGLEDAAALRDQTKKANARGARLHWSGYASFQELLAVCEVICKVRAPSSLGVWSDRQLAFSLNKLRSFGSMRQFFLWYAHSYKGQSGNQDNIFKFLRACEYGLPQMFSLVQIFARQINDGADYSLLVAEMPRWFRPEILKHLDEQGIPIQVSERFVRRNDTLESLSRRLIDAATASSHMLSNFEADWIVQAIGP